MCADTRANANARHDPATAEDLVFAGSETGRRDERGASAPDPIQDLVSREALAQSLTEVTVTVMVG
jgi:hypothetical protein